MGDSGEPRLGGELGEPGESGILSKEEREELLPVLMLMLIEGFTPLSGRVGLSSDWFSLAENKRGFVIYNLNNHYQY